MMLNLSVTCVFLYVFFCRTVLVGAWEPYVDGVANDNVLRGRRRTMHLPPYMKRRRMMMVHARASPTMSLSTKAPQSKGKGSSSKAMMTHMMMHTMNKKHAAPSYKGKGSSYKGKGLSSSGKGSSSKGKGSSSKGKGSSYKGKRSSSRDKESSSKGKGSSYKGKGSSSYKGSSSSSMEMKKRMMRKTPSYKGKGKTKGKGMPATPPPKDKKTPAPTSTPSDSFREPPLVLPGWKGPTAVSWGDPHIVTYDRLSFDCQGRGDFVLARAIDNPEYQIQARFEAPTASYPEVSITTAVAAAAPGLGSVEIYTASVISTSTFVMMGQCPLNLYVDGILQDLNLGYVSQSVRVESFENKIDIYFGDSVMVLTITALPWLDGEGDNGCYLNTFIGIPNTTPVVGLLGGLPNGSTEDDWQVDDDLFLSVPMAQEDLLGFVAYAYCTQEWCNRNTESSLFTEEGEIELDNTCDLPFPGVIDPLSASNEVGFICGSDDPACLIDGIVGGTAGALGAIEVRAQLGELGSRPPATSSPTEPPTKSPTSRPTTVEPTPSPTRAPTTDPSESPSVGPSPNPTTLSPTSPPTLTTPTPTPTGSPTFNPTFSPSVNPSSPPSNQPTITASVIDTQPPIETGPTPSPSESPTNSPSSDPTQSPSSFPTRTPTVTPSHTPALVHTSLPSSTPTQQPSMQPTMAPSSKPTSSPTSVPSRTPSAMPTEAPVITEFCACSPSEYVFEFNFDALCSESSVEGPGIESTSCSIGPSPGSPLDISYVPAIVDEIVVWEYDQASVRLVQTTILQGNSPFVDGERFSYTSITATNSTLGQMQRPLALELMISGENASGERVLNQVAVAFTNECDVFPDLSPGTQIGWVSIARRTPPVQLYCPDFPDVPTSSPSVSPSAIPTSMPSVAPSVAPTRTPSGSPTEPPSRNPSASPTGTPSLSPSAVPTESSTANPSGSPSSMPTPSPSMTSAPTTTTRAPSATPSARPTSSPSVVPTASPSTSPSAVPTKAPSKTPSATPTASPSHSPTDVPSAVPTASPSQLPTRTPSVTPSAAPSAHPSLSPSSPPTGSPPADCGNLIDVNVACNLESGENCNVIAFVENRTCFSSDALQEVRLRYNPQSCDDSMNEQMNIFDELVICADSRPFPSNDDHTVMVACRSVTEEQIPLDPTLVEPGDLVVVDLSSTQFPTVVMNCTLDMPDGGDRYQSNLIDVGGEIPLSVKETFGAFVIESCEDKVCPQPVDFVVDLSNRGQDGPVTVTQFEATVNDSGDPIDLIGLLGDVELDEGQTEAVDLNMVVIDTCTSSGVSVQVMAVVSSANCQATYEFTFTLA